VSLRHQEAVISFSRASGELNWILGSHDNWAPPWQSFLLEPTGELQWPFHQHAAELTPTGSVLIFDNGNFRALPPREPMSGAEAYSRAVEYMIDAEAKTVAQIWSYGAPGEDAFFSPFISEADSLPVTGNVLITDGGRVEDENGVQTDEVVGGNHWARIVEVTGTDDPQVVFELVVDSSEHEPDIGWAVYRSERLPSLYANQLP
jgi:arylsulfate sulfotransferase